MPNQCRSAGASRDGRTMLSGGTALPRGYAARGWLGVRIQVRCRRFDGHPGPVIGNGPRPTGERTSMSRVAPAFGVAS